MIYIPNKMMSSVEILIRDTNVPVICLKTTDKLSIRNSMLMSND